MPAYHATSALLAPSSPLEAAAAYPIDQPLLLLHSGSSHSRWARWSFLGSPLAWFRFDEESSLQGSLPGDSGALNWKHDPLLDFETVLSITRRPPSGSNGAAPGGVAGGGGWIGFMSYDLGRMIEPKAQHTRGAVADRDWPRLEFGWCPRMLVYDHLEQRWIFEGAPAAHEERFPVPSTEPSAGRDCFATGARESRWSRETCIASVARVKEYIAAGDIFQANLAQRLSSSFRGSTRDLMLRAMQESSVPYGAYLELPCGRCLLSMSPELFLHLDAATGEVVTRPIKGTRPSGVDPALLRESEKDAAELHMIVDLMRNDLGRVCRFGSVEVREAREIETHRTVHHGVAEVRGELRREATPTDLLRATFPPGSVTGAPKIRAMQIIDELEPVRRGPYCGAIGMFSDDGSVRLSVAIRTMLLQGTRSKGRWDRLEGVLDYSVGAGIVADSDPQAEHREMLDKAAVLEIVLAAGGEIGSE